MEQLNVLQVFLAQAAPEVAKQAASAVAPAPPDLSFWGSMLNAGWAEQLVMVVLVGFSVVSWAIIGYKHRMLRRAYQESEEFLDTFWASKRLDDIYQKSEEYKGSPVSQVYRAGFVELAKLKQKEKGTTGDIQMGAIESVERSMRRAASKELTNLESLVAFLGTTGATTPFIGLFGTVIGIMSAFQKIGIDKTAGLETVAPGIGGALVATAFGLFAAIPAVIAYNYFLTRIKVLDAEMDHFSADFLNIIKRHFF
jgi:biopolymer transport protein TolQ